MRRIAGIFNYRPLTFIGILTAIHTIAYGVGYMLPTSGFEDTVLYGIISQIADPAFVGVVLVILGLYSVWAWFKEKPNHIATSCSVMAFFWLFAAMSYFVTGAIGLGVGIGLVWSLLSGYLGFAYVNRDETVARSANDLFMRMLND